MSKPLTALLSLLAVTSMAPVHGADRSTDCRDILPADMSRYDFSVRSSNTYEYAELGRGTTYEDSSKAVRLSVFTYDLGYTTITADAQEESLSLALRDMHSVAEQQSLTYGDAYRIPSEFFEAMRAPMTTGLYTQSTSVNNPEFVKDELLAIGAYRDCIVKVRLSIPTEINMQASDGDPYKLFWFINSYYFQQLGEGHTARLTQ